MSKPLNAKVKAAVAIGLVAASTKKTGTKLAKELRALQAETRKTLLEHWNTQVPEITEHSRQLDLITKRVVDPANGANLYFRKRSGGSGQIFLYEWVHSSTTGDAGQKTKEPLWDACVEGWSCGDVIRHCRFSHSRPDIRMYSSFPDVPHHPIGSSVVEDYPSDILNLPQEYVGIHIKLYALHNRVVTVLQKMVKVLEQAVVLRNDIEAAMAPIKNSGVLLETFPEAVNHLPEGFGVKTTQELADPAVINKIRAKLAAGLPV